ncbi:formate dehydrogenase accessory sulfurtransferase FdhD [Histidinibacterium aquaticum]|uniref:Sulfur carrier protein FdhD n=1 Tax=Histidinibacterium aquaticum TaxID=2613962 RepID=A0A5J5GDH9_9RHOB|nr:formate dehydrogenase accessory sulfurtransferase FdhD [Histidinibacterium aquaticum]KAA9006087.1 formate dehydrogenase accessory sulfurtransferase FdhD [Histidinibacterium aquaticum]
MSWTPVRTARGTSIQPDGAREISRSLPEEAPVAMVYDGSTQAVMMATPQDIEDFATGFTLTEGFANLAEIGEIEVAMHDEGIEARMWLPEARRAALAERRRYMAGPVGCGLCGIDSLSEATRALPEVPEGARFAAGDLARSTDDLRGHQPLQDRTRAVHAAGFLRPGEGIVLAREDVGRHNALDKLIGALARAGIDPAGGAIVLTSRVSTEMVQKTVMAGCPVLVAVSAPTAHALRLAEGAGLTLAAFARGGGVDLYAHPHRVRTGESHVA